MSLQELAGLSKDPSWGCGSVVVAGSVGEAVDVIGQSLP